MNKLHLFITFLAVCLSSFTCKEKNEHGSYIYDFEKILSKEQWIKLDSLYASHEEKTTNQIALITTSDFSPDSSIESYSLSMGRKLGIGQKEKDNGVLIVFSNQQRQTRIATGYGTELILTDEIAKNIIDNQMLPNFKQDKYFEGIWAGSLAIVQFLEKPGNEIPVKK